MLAIPPIVATLVTIHFLTVCLRFASVGNLFLIFRLHSPRQQARPVQIIKMILHDFNSHELNQKWPSQLARLEEARGTDREKNPPVFFSVCGLCEAQG